METQSIELLMSDESAIHSNPTSMTTPTRYHPSRLQHYAHTLLQKVGVDSNISSCVAQTLLEGDLLGHDTHGLALLAGYLQEIEVGNMTRTGQPIVLSDKPAALLWDGQRLPGPWLVHQALDVLTPRAKHLGVSSMVIKRSHHIACLAVYMLRALKDDLLMVLTCSDPNTCSVAPFGGTQAVFTPNPLSIGFPLSNGGVMVDISASITTNSMNNRKLKNGLLHDGEYMMDAKGNASRDPGLLNHNPPGTLLPVGGKSHGHKGYGLALLVESLTGGLAGHGRADPKEGWGATVNITLYDLNAFAGKAGFLKQMDEIAKQCHASAPINPDTPVRLPGERGLKLLKEQMSSGVILHPSVAPSLQSYEQRFGLKLEDAKI